MGRERLGLGSFRPNLQCFCHGRKQEEVFMTDFDIFEERSVCMLQDYFDKWSQQTFVE